MIVSTQGDREEKGLSANLYSIYVPGMGTLIMHAAWQYSLRRRRLTTVGYVIGDTGNAYS